MNIKYNMVVDFAHPSKSNTITISEGDSYSRVCKFTLLSDKQPFDMIDVTSATVRGVKEDGSVIFGDATISKDSQDNYINEIVYTIPGAMADTAGRLTMTITLASSQGEQITSFEFYVTVRNALYNEDDYVSDTDLSGFRALLNRCMAALEIMENMTSKEALPNPYPLNIKVDGTSHAYTGSESVSISLGNVAYLDETTEQEIEESSDETAAKSALTSAGKAKTSETNSGINASAAFEYEENAKAYAETAFSSKNSAKQYSGEALASANAAKQSAADFSSEITAIKKAITDLGGNI